MASPPGESFPRELFGIGVALWGLACFVFWLPTLCWASFVVLALAWAIWSTEI